MDFERQEAEYETSWYEVTIEELFPAMYWDDCGGGFEEFIAILQLEDSEI